MIFSAERRVLKDLRKYPNVCSPTMVNWVSRVHIRIPSRELKNKMQYMRQINTHRLWHRPGKYCRSDGKWNRIKQDQGRLMAPPLHTHTHLVTLLVSAPIGSHTWPRPPHTCPHSFMPSCSQPLNYAPHYKYPSATIPPLSDLLFVLLDFHAPCFGLPVPHALGLFSALLSLRLCSCSLSL